MQTLDLGATQGHSLGGMAQFQRHLAETPCSGNTPLGVFGFIKFSLEREQHTTLRLRAAHVAHDCLIPRTQARRYYDIELVESRADQP